MSLAIVLCNKNGIVVSTDIRRTTKFTDPNTGTVIRTSYSNHSQKSYLTKQGHAITFTGADKLDNGEFAHNVIFDLLRLSDSARMSVKAEFELLLNELCLRTERNTVYITDSAVENGKNTVLYGDTNSRQTYSNMSNTWITYSGMSDVLKEQIKDYHFNDMTIQEMVEFVKEVNSLTAKKYSSVSDDVDLIVLDSDEAYRVTPLHRQHRVVDP